MTWKWLLLSFHGPFLAWYSYSQTYRPYLTQLCLTPVIYCIGDFSAQMIGNDDDFDHRRTIRSFIIGLLLYTPLFNVYFFASHGLLSGEAVTGAAEGVQKTVPISIPRSFPYWPLVTAFNFTYVKPQ
ncbi:hypothetical protein BDW62DRAFT_214681 [Aspergillus aurantiobrunneus]